MVSPAEYHIRAQRAWHGEDYLEAMQLWSHAVALQPADSNVHYLRGTALAASGRRSRRLTPSRRRCCCSPHPTWPGRFGGHRAPEPAAGSGAARDDGPLEHGPGVWIAQVVLDILGNTFLGRYRVTVDADRRQLQLRLLARD